MKNIIFSNYYDSDREKAAREFLLEDRGEDNGWETIDDIPDSEVWEEMNFSEEIEWEDVKSELKGFFEGKTILVTGTCGTWRGNLAAGAVIKYNELYKCWNNCDYLEIYDEGGRMYINASHHDGTNHFEVLILTEKGEEAWERYSDYYSNSKWDNLGVPAVHEKLAANRRYTHIPHFAREVYGCKTR